MENYVLGKLLGKGSYAQVKEATNKSTNIKYAVKVYEKYRVMDS